MSGRGRKPVPWDLIESGSVSSIDPNSGQRVLAIDEMGAYFGRIVGDAHARQMSAAQRKAWHGILRASRSTQVDAPSWLWQAIVDALASHERGYLQHCRRHIALIG